MRKIKIHGSLIFTRWWTIWLRLNGRVNHYSVLSQHTSMRNRKTERRAGNINSWVHKFTTLGLFWIKARLMTHSLAHRWTARLLKQHHWPLTKDENVPSSVWCRCHALHCTCHLSPKYSEASGDPLRDFSVLTLAHLEANREMFSKGPVGLDVLVLDRMTSLCVSGHAWPTESLLFKDDF